MIQHEKDPIWPDKKEKKPANQKAKKKKETTIRFYAVLNEVIA